MKRLFTLLFFGLSLFAKSSYIVNINIPRIESGNTRLFTTHKEALAMNITYSEVVSARMQIEDHLGVKLNFFKGWKPIMGEAHITVITPVEFEVLKKYISMSEINNIARKNTIQSSHLKLLGIGSAKKKENETFFIIVKSENLLKIRNEIYTMAQKRAKEVVIQFSPNWYFAHITIGYIGSDLHEKDGAIKNMLKSYDKRFILK